MVDSVRRNVMDFKLIGNFSCDDVAWFGIHFVSST